MTTAAAAMAVGRGPAGALAAGPATGAGRDPGAGGTGDGAVSLVPVGYGPR